MDRPLEATSIMKRVDHEHTQWQCIEILADILAYHQMCMFAAT